MDFRNQYVFILGIVLLFYIYWYVFFYKKISLSVSFRIKFSFFEKILTYLIGIASFLLEILILVVLLIGSSGPYFQEENHYLISHPVKIVWILLDVSESMNTPYETGTRIEYAKQVIDSVLMQNDNDVQYGLAVFAEQAYILSPPTQDYGFIRSLLKDIKSGLIGNKGTDIAKAFTVLYAATRQSDLSKEGYGILVLSDGGENRSFIPYTNIVRYANLNSISISGVCIGDSLVYDPNSRKIVRTDYNIESMRYLVENTGGVLVVAGDENYTILERWIESLPTKYHQEIIWKEPKEISSFFYFSAFCLFLFLVIGKFFGVFNPLED